MRRKHGGAGVGEERCFLVELKEVGGCSGAGEIIMGGRQRNREDGGRGARVTGRSDALGRRSGRFKQVHALSVELGRGADIMLME